MFEEFFNGHFRVGSLIGLTEHGDADAETKKYNYKSIIYYVFDGQFGSIQNHRVLFGANSCAMASIRLTNEPELI